MYVKVKKGHGWTTFSVMKLESLDIRMQSNQNRNLTAFSDASKKKHAESFKSYFRSFGIFPRRIVLARW